MTYKVYAYVDESGQDTKGNLFIVSVVTVNSEYREVAQALCVHAEQQSGKGAKKWIKAGSKQKIKYLNLIITPAFEGRLTFAVYRNHDPQGTVNLVRETITRSLGSLVDQDYSALVIIDGLAWSLETGTALKLRRSGAKVNKVRGLRDESEALLRLADSVCGCVRAALSDDDDTLRLFSQALQTGNLIDLDN
jgi:hypothetical protein